MVSQHIMRTSLLAAEGHQSHHAGGHPARTSRLSIYSVTSLIAMRCSVDQNHVHHLLATL